jgi:hypothetical protein
MYNGTYDPSVSSGDINNLDTAKYTALWVLLGLVTVGVLCVAFIICYVTVNCLKCKKCSKKNRERKDSDRNEFYQNMQSNRNRNLSLRDSVQTLENRPLPQLPARINQSVYTPAEDDYLEPISLLWQRHQDEIRNLPPAPPVFPQQLANLSLDGEGVYLPVISDDATPLLPPNPQLQVSSDTQLPEMYDENGYVSPRLLTNISIRPSSSERKYTRQQRDTEDYEDKNTTRASSVVTTQDTPRQCLVVSECSSSVVEDTSTTSTTHNEAQSSNGRNGERYRSTLQIYLSPATQHRSTPVPASNPTVLVCIGLHNVNLPSTV